MQAIPQFPPSLPLNLYNQGDLMEISLEISQTIPQNSIENDLKDPVIPLKSLKRPGYDELLTITEACLKTLEEIEKTKEEILHLKSRKRDQIIGLISRPLEILKSQYFMIYDILQENPETEEKVLVIMQKYGNLGIYSIEYTAQKGISFHTLTKCLEVSSKEILQELRVILRKIILKKPTKKRIGQLQVSVAKLNVLSEFLPHAATMDPEDIFALNKEVFEASDFQDIVQVRTIASSKEIREAYKRLISSMSLAISMYNRAKRSRNPFSRPLSTSLGIIYDSVLSSNSDIQKRTNLFYSQPNGDVLFQVWNVLDDKTLTKMFKLVYPSIKHSRKVYIPELYDTITFDVIQQSYEDHTINTTSSLPFGPQSLKSLEEIAPITKKSSTYKDLRKKLGEKIPLRILSAETLPVMKNKSLPYIDEQEDRQWQDPGYSKEPKLQKASFKARCFGFFHKAKEEKEIPKGLKTYFDGVVIHIHGGGFVAMSSCSHQTYTRQWAKQVGKAVLSIDYKLAPKFPYPTAIDDCWQAYNWILNDMEKSIGIKPSKIVLTGDSAGGNLALALTFLAIKNNVRVPNGLMLAYPALRVDVNSFTPSYLIALHDQILPHSVLKLIPGAYVPEGGRPKEDPLLSPLYASDELLKRLPPIRMMVGEKDPLHDDCWRLVDRLKKLEKDVKMTVYRDLAHGFLGYDMPGGLRMAKVCIKEAADMIKELLEK